jgi:L-ribulose-5-phosphate 3-epimerase
MKRRDFVILSGAALAGGTLAPRARAAIDATSSRAAAPIRLAVKYGMIGVDGSVRDKFQLLQDLGYDGVEMDSPSNLDIDEVVAASREVGLPIHGVVDSVHWSRPFSHPDANVRAEGVRALDTAIRDCHAFGGSTVLVVPAVVDKGVSYADAYARSQHEIRKCLPLAKELGIRIAFENVWNNFLLSPLEAARYVDEFDSDLVGWYFDVGNILRYGWPEHWIAALGHRVFKLDVKEYSRTKMNDEGVWKGFDVEITDGDCDWPAVRKALAAIGFDGWATAEVGGGGRERLADILARMRRALHES